MTAPLWETLGSSSFLEWAFLRWVLAPAVRSEIASSVIPQRALGADGHTYFIDYEFEGESMTIAVELDGFEFHGNRYAFSYDRMRQNDLARTGRVVLRFSYDSVRLDTARCVAQLQDVLRADGRLQEFVVSDPIVERPEMDPDQIFALTKSPTLKPSEDQGVTPSYFDTVRGKLDRKTLRECQKEAFAALANYYGGGGKGAACVMYVGAGKTALGVAACLGFTRKRAMVVTPGTVIRGTFDTAFDYQAVGNALYGLSGGPLIPGCKPPAVKTLDSELGAVSAVTRDELLAADVIVANFHSLGTGDDPDHLLSKLGRDDIDFSVVDEAHIAASESYQRLFRHFKDARTFLMSACFQRLDGKPIDADVVYRYRLVDSIADGNAKNLRVHPFLSDGETTTYEMVWPDGSREEIVGRDAILELLADENKLSRVTAKSSEPIRQVMRIVKRCLDEQAETLFPIKPRVLFSALGERHAEQIARDRRGARNPMRLGSPFNDRVRDQAQAKALRVRCRGSPRSRSAQDAWTGLRLPEDLCRRADASVRQLQRVLSIRRSRHTRYQSPITDRPGWSGTAVLRRRVSLRTRSRSSRPNDLHRERHGSADDC